MTTSTHEQPQIIGKVLIIDDEPDIGKTLSGILTDDGHKVTVSHNAQQGMKLMTKEQPDVCFVDVWLPDADGVDVLEKIKGLFPEVSVIMISGHANIETAVRCTRLGAVDFIEKPLSLEKVLLSVQNALRIKQLRAENQNLRNRLEKRYKLIGQSRQLEKIRQTIEMVATKNSTILITGENGTGKENVARMIHENSQRSKKPFIAINCAAIPEELIESELFGHEKGSFTGATGVKRGKFELAHGGTLFLDEIGDMSLKTQSKLLRVLQEQKFERIGGDESINVDVRVIAATNKTLPEEIKKGNFREDLFYRLNVIPIELPPLRERHDDIGPIAEHYLEFYSIENSVRRKQLAPQTIDILRNYSWPGNIRELKNVMERLSIMVNSDIILPDHLPEPFNHARRLQHYGSDAMLEETSFKEARLAFEKAFILKKLGECGGNISKTADLIGMERSHLHRKLRQFELGLDLDRKAEED